MDAAAIDLKGEDVVAGIAPGDIERHLFLEDLIEVEVGVEDRFRVVDGRYQVFAAGRDDGAAAVKEER